MMGATLPPRVLAPTVNCSVLVPSPVDASPIRSPQALHSHIAARVARRRVVEVGTRHGDGLACVAQTAASVVAIEASAPYCAKLRARAASLLLPETSRFSVLCSRYQAARPWPAADVYTWWQQAPHLTDAALLAFLRRQQLAGHVGDDAVALIAFDLSWPVDRRSFRALGVRASWSATVDFDERAACHARAGVSARQQRLCAQRAHGTFVLAELPIRDALPGAGAHQSAGEVAAARPPPGGRALSEAVSEAPPVSAAGVAYCILGHPYAAGAGGATSKNGFVPSRHVLALHLWALGELQPTGAATGAASTDLRAVLVVLSTERGRAELEGYTNVSAEAARLACPVEVLRVANNSLGS